MGFYEDDRIRRKNAPYHSANILFSELRDRKWSCEDIISHAQEGLTKDPTNEVMNALIRLCKSSIEANKD